MGEGIRLIMGIRNEVALCAWVLWVAPLLRVPQAVVALLELVKYLHVLDIQARVVLEGIVYRRGDLSLSWSCDFLWVQVLVSLPLLVDNKVQAQRLTHSDYTRISTDPIVTKRTLTWNITPQFFTK